jgi:opacity protein-like surface antigen
MGFYAHDVGATSLENDRLFIPEGTVKRVLAFVLLLAAPAARADVRFFTQLEYWTPAGAFEQAEDYWDGTLAAQLAAVNANAPQFGAFGALDSDISEGLGARAGVGVSAGGGWEWGGSLGYVKGPSADFGYYTTIWDFSFSTTDPIATRAMSDEYDTSFLRLLLEGRKRFSLGGSMEFRLGAGAGLAKGNLQRTFRSLTHPNPAYIPGLDTVLSADVDESWTGFTWEAGPSVAFVREKWEAELAVVYASFPKTSKGAGQGFSEFKWNPLGVRLGVAF